MFVAHGSIRKSLASMVVELREVLIDGFAEDDLVQVR